VEAHGGGRTHGESERVGASADNQLLCVTAIMVGDQSVYPSLSLPICSSLGDIGWMGIFRFYCR
jgi:hypothetical protein